MEINLRRLDISTLINSTLNTGKQLYRNPHFWIFACTVAVLIGIYLFWPWTNQQISSDIWQRIPWFHGFFSDLALLEFQYRIIGSLFLIPFIYAAIIFWDRGALNILMVSFIVVSPLIARLRSELYSVLINITVLIFPLLIVSLAALELQWRRKWTNIFTDRENDRKLYLSKVLLAQENERKLIAQDLHDDTIQKLLVIANIAETCDYNNPNVISNKSDNKTDLIKNTALNIIDDLRAKCLNIRPIILDNLGLIAAIRWLVEDLHEKDNHILSHFILIGEERKVDSLVQTSLFRVVQEALNNIRRHSGATEAHVVLKYTPKYLKITIADNGKGIIHSKSFSELASSGQFGLVGIRERVESIGGRLEIVSKTNKGTSLLVIVNI